MTTDLVYITCYIDLEDTRPRHILGGCAVFYTRQEAEEHVAQCYIEEAEMMEANRNDEPDPPDFYDCLSEVIQDDPGYYLTAAARNYLPRHYHNYLY